MSVIEIENLTKDYGRGRGIFGVNLTINQGEMVGFVGTNGSGKTTTIRNILGYVKPTSGSVKVNGLSSWENSSEIAKWVGYVPGEIAFPDLPTGIDFLKCQAEFYGLKDMGYANELIQRLQLDPRANLKRMSKGMKQKTALVAALMNDAPIIILDEPTTGLDPLMRVTFLDIIKREHEKGKTIFMSSHLFEELETTCDRVALIDSGKIVDVADMNEIRNRPVKDFKIEFTNSADYEKFKKIGYEITRLQPEYNQVTIKINVEQTGELLGALKGYNVKFISELPYTLEKHFKNILFERKEKEIKNDVQ
ncbi:MAG: ABC transporter ATP-binding protein [Candidatus Borkfalkiaceae bacterium]|nr:ABC transporter ATP-binding protein [Christensenellaceae bacterium]